MIRTVTLAAAALALGACHFGRDREENRDPGPSATRTYDVGSFDRLEVAGPYDVNVVSSGAPAVSATGGGNLLDETEVTVEEGALQIRPKKRNGIRWNWGRGGKAVFTVNAAALRGAAIAGSGNINVDRVSGDFEGEIAGSGGLKLPAVDGGKVKLSIAGSGGVTAAGKADSVEIEIAGSGGVNAGSLASRIADVSIAGSGNVSANARETAEVDIMGSGNVDVTGGAKCTVSKAGSGNVRCS